MRRSSTDVFRTVGPDVAALATNIWPSSPPRNPDARSGSLRMLAGAALLAGMAIGAAILATERSSLEWGVASVCIAAVAAILAVGVSLPGRRAGVFLPVSFVGLWVIGYGVTSLAWRDPSADLLAQNAAQLRHGSLALGLAMATVGLLAWTVGYCTLHLRLLRALVSGLRRWSIRGVGARSRLGYSVGRIVAIYAVGLGARLSLLALGRYSYITADLQGAVTQSSPVDAVLSHFEFLTTVGLLLLAYTAFRTHNPVAMRWLAVALLLEIPFGLLSGMRSFLLLRLVGVGITYILVRRRVPVLGLTVFLCLMAVLSPFTNAYREEVRSATGTTVGATGAVELIPTLLGSTLTELSLVDLIAGPLDFVNSRLRFVDELAIVGQRTPTEIAYIPASDTLLETTTVLVPRALWSGKPVYTIGLQYARDFWNQPDSVISARSPTYPGDAYYRGGWIGLVLLMALLGGLMAAMNISLSPLLHPSALPMFVVAWTTLLNVEGSLSLLPAEIAQSLLITAVAMRWAATGQRGSKGPSLALPRHGS